MARGAKFKFCWFFSTKLSDSKASLMVLYSNILYKIKTEEKDNLISIKLGHTTSKFKQYIESQQ